MGAQEDLTVAFVCMPVIRILHIEEKPLRRKCRNCDYESTHLLIKSLVGESESIQMHFFSDLLGQD